MKVKLLSVGLLAGLFAFINVGTTSAAHVQPQFVSGNPTCAGLGYGSFELKVPDDGPFPGSGTYSDAATGFEVDIDVNNTAAGETFDWASNYGVNAVVAKGGPNANLYVYSPAETEDTGLHAPLGASGKWSGLSHISFCYDINLSVTKTAVASLTKTWSWDIEKSADQTQLLLSQGQLFPVNYEVAVDAADTDSDWAVDGVISVHNPHPTMSATVTGVTDEISGIGNVTVDCGVTFPYVLAGGATLNCTYASALPDADTRLNTATAATSGLIGGGSGTADVDFAGATVNEVDECIEVSDTNVPAGLGQVCATDAPKTFNYTLRFGAHLDADVVLLCGENSHENIASFVTNDTASTGQSTWTVNTTVECVLGCSLTQGYWKTHSQFGPAPYDDTWALLPSGENTPFFNSGQTWYEVFWTAPKGGNPYYQLAHQYAAAYLNKLNGADTTAIDAALADAAALLNSYNATQIESLKGKAAQSVKAEFTSLAGTLGSYNEGITGPGHCSE